MRKLMFIVCLLVVSVAAQAQFEKGKWVVNPSLTGLDFSYSKGEKARFGLQAQGGAFLVDNVALMLTVGAEWSKPTDQYTVGVGGRYYFDACGIYLGAGLKMNHYNLSFDGGNGTNTDFGLGLEAGYAFFLTRTITIEPAVYYDLSFKDSDWSKFGLKVGFGFYF